MPLPGAARWKANERIPMIMDGLLLAAATAAWATVLWFYGRAEYREPRWWRLFLAAAGSVALLWVPWVGWVLAAVMHYLLLARAFDFPRAAADIMTASALALLLAVRLLFVMAGPAPPAA